MGIVDGAGKPMLLFHWSLEVGDCRCTDSTGWARHKPQWTTAMDEHGFPSTSASSANHLTFDWRLLRGVSHY